MSTVDRINDLEWLRSNIIGRGTTFQTCFGERPMLYADYTASGRGLECVEEQLKALLPYYANTHTEDDFTGQTMSRLLESSESKIKELVNAGPNGKIIPVGTGATGGLERMLSILGVYLPPATRKTIDELTNKFFQKNSSEKDNHYQDFINYLHQNRPIVFVGPYEHHSNELIWRESFCDVVEIPLCSNNEFDLDALRKIVSSPEWDHRIKIGSFSAASNVTGIISPIYQIAEILHQNNAIACFDFAASAPYVEINMTKGEQSYFDAVVLSPHKFLGGPGSTGLLIFNERIYNKDLPPCVAGGGTVSYVTKDKELYLEDIEERELAGTPGILQTIKASLAFQIKDRVGLETIHEIEAYYHDKFFERFGSNDLIDIYGPVGSSKRINIFPFNIKHQDKILHPKFVTKLMNDLFGIQTRAGCSCAGPYGHKILNITDEYSESLTKYLDCRLYYGLKPGWVRVNLHYSFSLEEFNYLCDAIDFISKHGSLFLDDYRFDFIGGDWEVLNPLKMEESIDLNLEHFIENQSSAKNQTNKNINDLFAKSLEDAKEMVKNKEAVSIENDLDEEINEFMFFYVKHHKGKH